MSTQRIYQLLISFVILAVIAFISERSCVLASVVLIMPLNVTIALWFISTSTGGDAAISADFSRMAGDDEYLPRHRMAAKNGALKLRRHRPGFCFQGIV